MYIGMLGLGRMGAAMAQRLMQGGHQCVVYDPRTDAVDNLVAQGAIGSRSVAELVQKLPTPRVVWMMLPAAITADSIATLSPLLNAGDILVDGGNSDYRDAISHARELKQRGIDFVDVGTSGGVWGLREGYCLMIGGDAHAVQQLTPAFATLAPGGNAAASAEHPEQQGFLHCGPAGAGHFVKMVHNGVEYALMAAYAEGFNLLRHASRGSHERSADAETAPLKSAESYQYEFDVPAIAELWRHGSVVRSWLLDLAANALGKDADLTQFQGRVSDSGEGRWTLNAAIDLGVPMPTLAAALFDRFSSQGEDTYSRKLLSALRHEFGGHQEKSS